MKPALFGISGDKEEEIHKYVAAMCAAMKMFADVIKAPDTNHHRLEVVNRWMSIWASTGIDLTHKVETNFGQLRKTIIDD